MLYIYIYITSYSFNRPLFEKVTKLNRKVCELINWLKKNLKTHNV